MIGIVLISMIAATNVALGFAVATVMGHGPKWAEARLPSFLRAQPPEAAAVPAEASETAGH
jgi:hypothetical protein